jgi:ribosome modulation factor
MKKRTRTYAERKEGAFNAGLAAFREGKSMTDCPILRHQGLARAWKEGWLAGNADKDKQTSGMYIPKARAAEQPAEAAPAPLSAHG